MKGNNINIDLLCEDIYKCVPNNKAKFDQIMNDLKNKILNENDKPASIKPNPMSNKPDMKQQNKIYQFQPDINQNLNPNLLYHNQNFNQKYDFNPLFNQHKLYQQNTNSYFPNNFVTTLPEGEMLNMKPLQNKTLHKNYTDVHANTKFYYPDEYDNRSDIAKDVQWTDRANNINLIYTSTSPTRQWNDNYSDPSRDLRANRNMLMNNLSLKNFN